MYIPRWTFYLRWPKHKPHCVMQRFWNIFLANKALFGTVYFFKESFVLISWLDIGKKWGDNLYWWDIKWELFHYYGLRQSMKITKCLYFSCATYADAWKILFESKESANHYLQSKIFVLILLRDWFWQYFSSLTRVRYSVLYKTLSVPISTFR